MKNDSPLFSGGLFGDSWFDHNGDGKLSGLETIARDAYHMHMIHMTAQETQGESADGFGDVDDFSAGIYDDNRYTDTVYSPPVTYIAQNRLVDYEKAHTLACKHMHAIQAQIDAAPKDENDFLIVPEKEAAYRENFTFFAGHLQQLRSVVYYALYTFQVLHNAHITFPPILSDMEDIFLKLDDYQMKAISVLETAYPGLYDQILALNQSSDLPDIFLSPQERPSVPEKPETPKEEKKPKENRPAAPQMTEEEKRQKEIEAEKKRNKKIIIWTAVAIVAVIVILLMAFFESFATAVGLAFCVLMILVIGAGVGAFLGGGAGALIGVILSIFIIMITLQ